MLIISGRTDFPDHPYPPVDPRRRGENDQIGKECPWSWWFRCGHTATQRIGTKTLKTQCDRLHRVSCDGGTHISLPEAEAALRQAGWTRAPDGSWRCPQHR